MIEPLGAIKRCRGAGASITMRCDPPSGVMETTSPRPSTWPETIWPPSSSPSLAARSRLTRVFSTQSPSLVLDRVSPETSTANQPSPFSVTVRQQPAWLIEAPRSMLAVSHTVSTS
ncbi:hypothetical protein D3C80_1761310 [compost metagenome]